MKFYIKCQSVFVLDFFKLIIFFLNESLTEFSSVFLPLTAKKKFPHTSRNCWFMRIHSRRFKLICSQWISQPLRLFSKSTKKPPEKFSQTLIVSWFWHWSKYLHSKNNVIQASFIIFNQKKWLPLLRFYQQDLLI